MEIYGKVINYVEKEISYLKALQISHALRHLLHGT